MQLLHSIFLHLAKTLDNSGSSLNMRECLNTLLSYRKYTSYEQGDVVELLPKTIKWLAAISTLLFEQEEKKFKGHKVSFYLLLSQSPCPQLICLNLIWAFSLTSL